MVGLITCKTHGGDHVWPIQRCCLQMESDFGQYLHTHWYLIWAVWIHEWCAPFMSFEKRGAYIAPKKWSVSTTQLPFYFFTYTNYSITFQLFWTNLYHITWMNMDIRCRCSWDGPLLCWAYKSRLDHWISWLQVVTALPPHWIYWRFVHSLPVSSWCALICGSRDVPAIFSQVSNVLIELYWKRL